MMKPARKVSIWVSREIYFGRERRAAVGGLGRDSRATARDYDVEVCARDLLNTLNLMFSTETVP